MLKVLAALWVSLNDRNSSRGIDLEVTTESWKWADNEDGCAFSTPPISSWPCPGRQHISMAGLQGGLPILRLLAVWTTADSNRRLGWGCEVSRRILY